MRATEAQTRHADGGSFAMPAAGVDSRGATGRPRPMTERLAPYLAVLVAVLAANAAYITGWSVSDPVATRANVHATTEPGVLGGQYTLDPNNGFTAHALGVQGSRQLLSGDLPWWNHYEGLGAPLAAEMQSAPFFPGTWLQLLPAGKLLLSLALQMIAGWSTVAVLRRLRLSGVAAAAGGVLFALCGPLVWLANAAMLPIAFLPLLILGIEQAAAAPRERRFGGTAVVSVALALSLVSGFPETAYLDGLLAGVWALWRFVDAADGAARLRLVARVGAGAVLGLATAAVAVVPFLAYVAEGADIGGHADVFAERGLPLYALGSILAPYAYGPIAGFYMNEVGGRHLLVVWMDVGGYATAALLALALFGLMGGRTYRGLRLALAAFAVIALLRTMAVPGVTQALNLIPGMKLGAVYRYAYPAWLFALVVLAALGIDDAVRRPPKIARTVVSTLLAAAALVACALVGLPLSRRLDTLRADDYFTLSYLWAAATILAIGGLLALARVRPRLAAGGIAGIVVLEAIAFAFVPTLSAPRSWEPDAALADFVASPPGPGRVYSIADRFSPNYGSYYDTPQLNVNDLPVPELWADYVREELDEQASASNFYAYDLSEGHNQRRVTTLVENVDGFRDAGVRWVIAPAGPLPEPLGDILDLVEVTPTSTIYELRGWRPIFDDETGACRVQARGFDHATVDCRQPSRIIRRVLWDEGWSAEVDGEAVDVRRVETALQEIAVPAGRSTVRFSYSPPFAGPAIALTLLGLAGTVAVATRRLRRS